MATVSTISITLLILVGSPLLLSESNGQTQTHVPIRISSDSDFLLPQSGVTGGDGTYGNPFVIEGWDIDAASTTGIHIRNTQSYFVIRNVFVHSGYPSAGIRLESVTNGIIQDTTLADNQYGVWLSASNGNSILRSDIRNNSIAILLSSSSNNAIADNQLSDNSQYGLWFSSGSNSNTVTGNNMSSIPNGSGIQVSSSSNNFVANNIASGNRWFGISLTFSDDNVLQNNTADSSHVGIVFVESSRNTATKNFASNNDYGIGLEDPNIENALLTADNTVSSNTIRDSHAVGLYTFRAVRTQLYDNRLNNQVNAVDDGTENSWYVSKQPGTNILGGPFIGGNYYSNYVGADLDKDGIGDAPYNGILGSSQSLDNYPLISEQPTVVHDVAMLEVSAQPSTSRAGSVLSLTARLFNQGTVPETFSVRFSYNSTLLSSTVEITALPSWSETTATILWNTANVPPASYAVRAEAVNVDGEVDTSDNISPSTHVSLSPNSSPSASLKLVTQDPASKSPVAFDAGESTDADNDPLQFHWDLGDGSTAIGATVSHVYIFSGTYRVILTVTDDHGGSATVEYTLTLSSNPPAPPVIIAITLTGTGAVLTWAVPISNGGRPLTNYRVYRGTTSSDLVPIALVGNVTSYIDPGPLSAGQAYFYAVEVLTDAGQTRSLPKEFSVPPLALSPLPFQITWDLIIVVAALPLIFLGRVYVRSRKSREAQRDTGQK